MMTRPRLRLHLPPMIVALVIAGASIAGETTPTPPSVSVLHATPERTILRFRFDARAPDVARCSVIVPARRPLSVRILNDRAGDVTSTASSALTRHAPADLGDRTITLSDTYVLRDVSGVTLTVNPVHRHAHDHTISVHTALTLEITALDEADHSFTHHRPQSTCRAFDEIYRAHFINYEALRPLPPPDEQSEMLIIAYDPWIPNVLPLAEHKNAIGIDTTVIGISEIGSTAAAVKNYIQSVYDATDVAFVLLVGDAAHVPAPYIGGSPADPVYAKLDGADDYPDICIGRFSAETAIDVDTQVQRTIEYELNQAPLQDWFWRGTGIGAGTAIAHLDAIRDTLIDAGYTHIDQLYDPGVTADMIIDALNDGRGIVNYVGQASPTFWGTGAFTVAHINALTNDNTLPFIISVASLNGAFAGQTCLAEAWLRAMHDGAPTGAIAAYMSSSNQSWLEPLTAHEAIIDNYVNEDLHTFGALCFAGACTMIDEYGSSGAETFNNWIVFGDPSLRIVGTVEFVCPADVTGDGLVDVLDLLAVLAAWGQSGVPEDITGDGLVDTLDLLALLAAWGPCP